MSKKYLYQKELNEIKKIIASNFPFKQTEFGKMIRSTIGVLLLKSLDIKPNKKYLNFLASIELLHNASLLQDDVIDNTYQRRGYKNVKSETNNKISVIYSDILIVNAIKLLPQKGYKKIINIILETISYMCKGELIQYSQLNKIPTLEEYIEKSKLKTAILFVGMIKGLAELTSDTRFYELTNFGENFGIAYQLKNDTENILTTNTDALNGVYTAGYIYSQKKELTKASLEKTVSLTDNYINKSIEDLSSIKESIYKEELVGVVKCLRE